MDILTAYGHIDTMQKVCMDEHSWITLEEWLSEDEAKCHEYYTWLHRQFEDHVVPWHGVPTWH